MEIVFDCLMTVMRGQGMMVKSTSLAVYDDVHLARSFYKVSTKVERQVCALISVIRASTVVSECSH